MDSSTPTNHCPTDLSPNGEPFSGGSNLQHRVARKRTRKAKAERDWRELVPAKIRRSTLEVARILAACDNLRISVYLDELVKRDLIRDPDRVPRRLRALLEEESQEPPEIRDTGR
jgi:hypothetical protein